MSINSPDIKKLYGKAAGQCSICKINLFENDVHIGQMAHMIAKSAVGPRGNEALRGEVGINSYDNLILLCANHHIEVDSKPNLYPIPLLHQIKREHEDWISSCTKLDENKRIDKNVLSHVVPELNLFRLIGVVDSLPDRISINFLGISSIYDELRLKFPEYIPFRDAYLNVLLSQFLCTYNGLAFLIFNHDSDGTPYFHGTDNGDIVINKYKLKQESLGMLRNDIEKNKQLFITATQELIKYIRSNYSV